MNESFLNSLNSSPAIIEENLQINQNAHLEQLISEIFKTDNIGIRSDLTKEQILVFSKAQLYADNYNVSIITKLCNNFMTLSLSKNRSSRKELVEISKSFNSHEPEASVTDRLLGR